MSTMQEWSAIYVAVISIIIFFFRIADANTLREHQQKLSALHQRIQAEKLKMKYRLKHLSTYNFLKYNLKEALKN